MLVRNLPAVRYNLPNKKQNNMSFLFLAFSFIIGCLVGSLVAPIQNNFFLGDFLGFETLKSIGFFYVFLDFIKFHIVAFLLGSSFLGVVLMPILCWIRGVSLSCTSAAIMACYPENGIIMAIIILGIPAILSLPCFFLITVDGFNSSRRLLNLVRGTSAPMIKNIYLRSILCLPILAAGTFLELKLIPYIVLLFNK